MTDKEKIKILIKACERVIEFSGPGIHTHHDSCTHPGCICKRALDKVRANGNKNISNKSKRSR